MNSKILSFLRRSNRLLARLLPQSAHSRLVRTAKAVYRDFTRPAVSTECVTNDTTQRKLLRPLKRDDIAKPLAPFISCSGRLIENDANLVAKLAEIGAHNSCELVICCAFSDRHKILEQVVNESLTSIETDNIRWMLVGSTAEDGKLIRALAIKTGKVAGCVVENRPLGRKWQTCTALATLYFSSELYGITGSDDILSSRLIDHIIQRHRKNRGNVVNSRFLPSMYGALEWLVFDNNSNTNLSPQIIKCNYEYGSVFQPLGAGRFFTRAFMKKFKGKIFESPRDSCLDDRGYFMVRDNKETLEYYTVEDGPIVSIKGNWSQMNTIEDFYKAGTLLLREYSFIGNSLLRDSLSESAYRFLFKSATISPQFNFTRVGSGIDGTDC